MEKLTVSEKDINCRYIAYISGVLKLSETETVSAEISFANGRVNLTVASEEECLSELRRMAEDKIAEVICVGYKYETLSRMIHPSGLGEEDREILLAAIISADFAEDKRYVLARLREVDVHTVDGFYNFRMQQLREKWKNVAACVPTYFDKMQLAEFMEFLLGSNKGKIFLKGSDVYDSRCRRLHRAALIEDSRSEINTFREIVLSGAGKVECLTSLSASQENFLRRYYSGRVGFYPG